eukprot:314804-Rhodomonas_salina.1
MSVPALPLACVAGPAGLNHRPGAPSCPTHARHARVRIMLVFLRGKGVQQRERGGGLREEVWKERDRESGRESG